MGEEGENLAPFWLQSTTNLRPVDSYRHRLSSLFFNLGVLLILLLVTAVFMVVFVIPTLLSFSAQIFRPNTVKKSWDSLNLVLVLFALLFGFLSRNRNDNNDSSLDHQYHRQTSSHPTNVVQNSNPSTPNKWYDYPDRTVFNNPTRSMGGLMRRNSTSYPELHLRELSSPWVTGDDQWRFYDDTHVNSYRTVDSDHRVYYRRRSWKQADNQDIETKNIHVDTFVSIVPEEESPYVSPPPYSPPPPPPPPPPQRRAAKEKEKRIYQSIAHEEKTRQSTVRNDLEPAEYLTPPPAAPPFPMRHWEQKSGRSDHKKRDGGNASKDNFLTSFYHKKKKKRQRQRSVENLDAFLHHSQPPLIHSQPPPPSVFHNLFSSRKGKRRRIPSDPHPAPPPPPPPPPPPFKAVRVLKSRTQTQPATTYQPPLPVKISSFKSVDENSSSGGSSPLVPIPPPPPPPPPFKMPDWKFVVQGDYVSIQSNPSSRSGSPDLDDVETCTPGGDATSSTSSLFCPSPDVDTKADNFIARFRAELKLQKIDSFNQKQGPRMSNLGPGLGLGPTQI